MKITNINIQNFRSFSDSNLSFANKTTVLIGKNGTGKSNLIAALKKGLSFVFAKDKQFERSLSDSNGCAIRKFSLCWDTRFQNDIRGFCFPIKIDFTGIFNGENIQWTLFKKTESGSISKALYQEALTTVLTQYNRKDPNVKMPLFAFFSDAYPHNFTKIAPQFDKLIHHNIVPRDLAYYDWDNIGNCSKLWESRYIKVYYDLLEFKSNGVFENEIIYSKACEKEVNFINQRLLLFTKPLNDLYDFINKDFEIQRIFVNKPDKLSSSISFRFSNGKQMNFDNLPQGYNRLLSIVFDICYRSYLLNEDQEPEGIVFIDEVELHLHPSMQQEVLDRFRKTFPNIQLIVSTHSPLVLSNLNHIDGVNNKIIKLTNNGENYFNEPIENNIYGVDYTTSLMDIMDAEHRPVLIDNLIDSYVILKHLGQEDEAMKIKKEIETIVGKGNRMIEEEINAKMRLNDE